MKNISKALLYSLGLFLLMSSIGFAQEDREGCKDHPLFPRMPGFYIYYVVV